MRSRRNGQVPCSARCPDEPQVNISVNGTIIDNNLPYSSSTPYISVNAGSQVLEVQPVDSGTPIVNITLSLAARTSTTVIVTGLYSIQTMVLTDGTTTPNSGTALIGLVNASPTMASPDIYVVPSGTSIAGASPLVAGLGFGITSTYETLDVPAGTSANYDVYFTEPSTPLGLVEYGTDQHYQRAGVDAGVLERLGRSRVHVSDSYGP